MEIIEKLAAFLAFLIVDQHDSKALQSFLELLIFVFILILVFYSKQILVLIPPIRTLISYGERYSGHYVQIINSENERRYSILDIKYSGMIKGYLLRGIQYETNGRRASDFDSQNMYFKQGPISYTEFIWRAETIKDKTRYDGYTQMRPDDISNLKMLEGRGFFITFDQNPRRFDLRFIKLTKNRLELLQLKLPKTEKERVQFIKDFHKKLEEHPELQPIEESGEALL